MLEKNGELFVSFVQKNGLVSLVILAVLAVRFLLQRYPKKYSYCLWAIVGVRMMFELPVYSRLSLFHVAKLFTKRVKQTTGISNPMNPIVGQGGKQAVETAAAISKAVAATETKDHLQPEAFVTSICFWVWMMGILVLAGYGIYGYVRCRRMVKTAVIYQAAMPLCSPNETKGTHKKWWSRSANVWECDQIPSPFVLGIWKPQIYIPFQIEAKERSYILAHEGYHILRMDTLWKLLAFLLLAVYWWNPLVWLSFFLMVRDMEMSCDEAVILSLGNEIKKSYSESLLTFAMPKRRDSIAPVPFGEGDVTRRIKNVLNFKKPRTWVAMVIGLVIVILAVSCLTNGQAAQKAVNRRTGQSTQNAQENADVYVAQWAEAFCKRDGDTIVKLATEAAQRQLREQGLWAGEGFGWSSPWPWGTEALEQAEGLEDAGYQIADIDPNTKTAHILYYARVSDPKVTIWKETIHYSLSKGLFQVTEEQIHMYEEIASAEEFDEAYGTGIDNTPMDYEANGYGELLNERSTSYAYANDPLLQPVTAAKYLLNLLDDPQKVQLESDPDGEDVVVHITFAEGDGDRQVTMVQPWGKQGIWVPKD